MAVETLQSVSKQSLREQALSILRDAITNGDISSGSHLSEVGLSTRLGISRGTLREAMIALEHEGLIVSDSRGRVHVRIIDEHEIAEIFQVRSALEGLAVEIICKIKDRTEIVRNLDKSLKILDSTKDIKSRSKADLELHDLIMSSSGNQTLLEAWRALLSGIRLTMAQSGTEKGLQNMAASRHKPIVDAIKLGDAKKARQIVDQHMKEAVDRLTSAMNYNK